MADADEYLGNELRCKMAAAKATLHPSHHVYMDVYLKLSAMILRASNEDRTTGALCISNHILSAVDVHKMMTFSWVMPTLRLAVEDLTWKLFPDADTRTTIIELLWS